MKKSIALSLFCLLIVNLKLSAQETEGKRMKLHDVYLFTGTFNSLNYNTNLEDFNKISPINPTLLNELKGYDEDSDFQNSTGRSFTALLGIEFKDKKKGNYKTNPLLRLGITYLSGNNLYKSYSTEQRTPLDTFVSINNGKRLYVDSLINKSYTFNYQSEQIRLDGSLIFRSNPNSRWSVYGGVGINAGISINAKLESASSEFSKLETRFENGSTIESFFYDNFSEYESKLETVRLQTNVGVLVYLPLGVDFRIGKKNPFWKRAHLFYEIRPGINITSIPELRTISNSFIQLGFGVRATLD